MALGSVGVLTDQALGGGSYGDSHRESSGGYTGPSANDPNAWWNTGQIGAVRRQTRNPDNWSGSYTAPQYRPTPQSQSALQNYLNIYGGAQAPTLQGLTNQLGLQQNQFDMIGPNQQLQRQFLLDDHSLALRGLGLDQQDLNTQRRGIGRDLRFSRREEEIARQMLANTQAQTNQGALEQTQAARNEAVAGGSMLAPGINTDLTNIYGNLVLDRQANQLGFDRDLLGIRQQRGHLRDQRRQLDTQAQRLGLTRDQLQNSLQQGLTNLRLDGVMNMSDLLMAMNDTTSRRGQLANDIFMQALQAAQFGR